MSGRSIAFDDRGTVRQYRLLQRQFSMTSGIPNSAAIDAVKRMLPWPRVSMPGNTARVSACAAQTCVVSTD
jgi:hypothetical protein